MYLSFNDIDIRKEFKELKDKYGVPFLYVKKSRYIKCKCWSELHEAGDQNCKYCHGLGKVTSVQKVKTIVENFNVNFEVGSYKNTDIGKVYSDYKTFYVSNELTPKATDLFIEAGWKNNIPYNVTAVYEVYSKDKFNCDNGRVEFMGVTVKGRPELVNKIQEKINTLNFPMEEGVKYLW